MYAIMQACKYASKQVRKNASMQVCMYACMLYVTKEGAEGLKKALRVPQELEGGHVASRSSSI